MPPVLTATATHSGLRRVLATRHVTMISMGGIIGAGLFVGSSAAIAAAGPAIVISYLLAGGLIFLVMRMLGEMAVALPDVQSFTDFMRAGLGDWAGFITGWLYWYFWIVVVPVEAIAGAQLLHSWVAVPPWLLGAGLMLVMTGVNLMSARSYGEFEYWFALVKITAILIFIALAIAGVIAMHNGGQSSWAHLSDDGGFAPRGHLAVLAGVTTVIFALTGAEITAVAAAESREPVRALARLSTTVITRILLFYVVSMVLIVTIVPWRQVVPGHSPFTQALELLHYRWAGAALSVVILTAVLSCLNSAFYVTSRVLFALAARGDAPSALVRLNARGVPSRSVWMGSVAGLAGIAAATLSPQGVFAFLVNASGALILFIYLLTVIAQIRLRRARSAAEQDQLAVKMWLFPWTSYAAAAGIVVVLVAMAFTSALTSQFYASVVAIAVACAAWWMRLRRTRI